MAAEDPSFCNLIRFVPQLSEKEHEIQQKSKTMCKPEIGECGEDIKYFYESIVKNDTTLNSKVTFSDPVIHEVEKNTKHEFHSSSSETKSASLKTTSNCEKTTGARKTEKTVSPKIRECRADKHHKSSGQVSFHPHSQTFKLLQAAQMNELEQVSVLLEKGADVNCQDYFGWTPLMVAAKQGNDKVVKYLLKHGSDQTICTFDGHTAVSLARLSGHEHIVATITGYSRCDIHNRCERLPNITTHGVEPRPHSVHDEVVENKSSGTYFCQVCKCEVSLCEKSHETSTVHLFNSGHKSKHPSYLLPETNKGFDMLLKMGWQVDEGLGPHGEGPKYPVKTILKLDRRGLGVDKCAKKQARITHFNANDKSAVEYHGELPARTVSARKAARYANRAKEKRDQQREQQLRSEFNDSY